MVWQIRVFQAFYNINLSHFESYRLWITTSPLVSISVCVQINISEGKAVGQDTDGQYLIPQASTQFSLKRISLNHNGYLDEKENNHREGWIIKTSLIFHFQIR